MTPAWRTAVLYVTALGMESCWLYALMALLNQAVAGGRLSVPGLWLLFPLSFGLNKLIGRLPWHVLARRGLSWLIWAAATLLMVKFQLFGAASFFSPDWLLAIPRALAGLLSAFRPELLILILSGALWWLGQRQAGIKLGFAALVTGFQFGLAILLVTLFAATQLDIELANAVSIILAFFLCALLGVSVAHAREHTSWLSGLYQGHWSGLLLVSISLILIAGLVAGTVVSPDLVRLIVRGAQWVWGLVMQAILFLASLLPEPSPAEAPPLPAPVPGVEEPELHRAFEIPRQLIQGLRIGWSVLMIGLILFALWRVSSQIFGWLRRRLASTGGAEFESLPGAFKADLLALLRRVLDWLLGLRPGRRRDATPPVIASVREVYRQLLRWAAARGYPRSVFQTPYEYLNSLADFFPAARQDLDLITSRYVAARYGATLPGKQEMHQLNASWHRLKQARPVKPANAVKEAS